MTIQEQILGTWKFNTVLTDDTFADTLSFGTLADDRTIYESLSFVNGTLTYTLGTTEDVAYQNGAWTNEAYRTINILSLDLEEEQRCLEFLQKNAIKLSNENENAFILNLYANSAEPSRVDKTNFLISKGLLSGVLRDECPIVAPVILIEYNKVIDFNYVHIPSFGRYYYVKNFTSIRKNLWQLELNVDVLMTYKDGIKSLQAFVDRNEFENNVNVIDDKVIIEQGYEIEDSVVVNDVFLNESGTNYGVSFILCGYGLEVK